MIDLVVLSHVVERGSFARAAAELGVPSSTLSRTVAALARRLGVRVLERTTRSLRPTELGLLLAERGERVRRELDDADRAVADHQRAPRGVLRLTVPTPVATDFIGELIGDYLQRYPDMRVDVIAEDRIVDLVGERFDAAIRVTHAATAWSAGTSTLGATRIATVTPVLAGTRAYLDTAPPLRHPRDLANHALVAFGRSRRMTWCFQRGDEDVRVELTARTIANSAPLVGQLVAAGAGLSVIPKMTALGANLEILEPGNFRLLPHDVHVVTPSAGKPPPKVRAFIDLLRAFCARHPQCFDVVYRSSQASR
jgi:DNA-binding transcriptional LysR family regulator